MSKKIIHTDHAPQAIGIYSQAVQVGQTLYISGQIPLNPKTMEIISQEITLQIKQVFENLKAIIIAAQASFDDVVKLTAYMTNLKHFALFNEEMSRYFTPPYPARAVVGVQSLPKGVQVEADAILVLKSS